jgi:hypothetical protein
MEKLPHYNFSWTVSLQNFGRGYGPVARRLILELELDETWVWGGSKGRVEKRENGHLTDSCITEVV